MRWLFIYSSTLKEKTPFIKEIILPTLEIPIVSKNNEEFNLDKFMNNLKTLL